MSVFLTVPKERIIYQSKSFFIIKDLYPVSPGHLLIISNRPVLDYFSLSDNERLELAELILVGKQMIEKDHKPDGYNIGMNCGESAGQTVMHFHCHLIPRYQGDMDNPRGGVRHCVRDKGYY
ncbi:MAG: HIT family protein [Chitinophagaceae bacterium]|nr:MAG: HIT family protein [Chitinophagaceae bacterium]